MHTSMPDVFATTPQETPVTKPASTDNVFADQLNAIKNDNGEPKYDDVPKALDALKHSQEYIPQLKTDLTSKEAEILQLKTELAKRDAVEDVVSRLKPDQAPPPTATTPEVKELDEGKLAEVVSGILQQSKANDAAQVNQDAVNKALFDKYGDKATEVATKKAAELGMPLSELQQLSRKSPAAALQLFGEVAQTNVSPTTTSVNIPPTIPNTEGVVPPAPEKSLLAGSTYAEQNDYLQKVKAAVYSQLGVQT